MLLMSDQKLGLVAMFSDLLFHPANFGEEDDEETVQFDQKMRSMDLSKMDATHLHKMMFDIQKMYKKINAKLQVRAINQHFTSIIQSITILIF